jgi:hypothetical protein
VDERLIGLEDDEPHLIGGNGLIDQLKSDAVMNQLVNYMLDPSPLSSSILTNGINIIIELIRRYCSEIEQTEYQQHNYHLTPHHNNIAAPPSPEKIEALAMDLRDLLAVLGARLGEFAGLLQTPRQMVCLIYI